MILDAILKLPIEKRRDALMSHVGLTEIDLLGILGEVLEEFLISETTREQIVYAYGKVLERIVSCSQVGIQS